MNKLGGAPKCPRCDKNVYFAEEAVAEGRKWHKRCLTCENCNKSLDSFNLTAHDGNIYCKSCYGKMFAPKGYGFAGGAAGLGAETGQTQMNGSYQPKRPSVSNLGSGPKCPRCGKTVYFAEERVAAGKKWHKFCVSCAECNKKIDSTTMTEHDGEIFCKTCYANKFGPKGYGFAGGAAGLARETEESRMRDNQAKRTSVTSLGNGPKCPRCHQTVYFAEEMVHAGKKWHKLCVSCVDCKKRIDSTNMTEHDGEIFCRTCYANNFGPKGYGFAGGAAGLARENANSSTPALAQAYVAGKRSRSSYGGADQCGRCGNSVYFAEKVVGGGNSYHKSCFSCALCNKMLDSTSVKDREGEIYCNSCYGRNFGPKGIGYGIGAGTLQTN